MTRYGHIPDRTDDRDKHVDRPASDLLAGGLSFPNALSYRGICSAIRSQKGNSCVGEFLARAVDTVARIVGISIAYPSPLAAYSLGREYDSMGADLVDRGSRPRAVMLMGQQAGLVSLERWDPDDADINEKVPADVLRAGADAQVTGAYRIDDGDIVGQICQALAAGHVAGFGMPIDDDYERYSGGVYREVTGLELGGHMQTIVGYDLAAPVPYFEVVNSWGPFWGEGGFSRISTAFVSSSRVFDRYVVTSSPKALE